MSRHNRFWIITVLVDTVVSIIASVIAAASDNDFVVHGFATVVLSSLIVFCAMGAKDTASSEVRADGVYYLGLLFTFIAMVLVLVRVGIGGQVIPEVIIDPFGIALVTTIVGLGGAYGSRCNTRELMILPMLVTTLVVLHKR